VAGGYDGGYLTSAELYNPTAGTWTSTGSIKNSRESHTATLLPNGQVLIVGGYNLGYLTSAELYNPTTGTWATTGNLNTGRTNHSATVLANGQVLVAGGFGGTGALTSGELYNATPVVGTFSATGSLNTGREEHQAILLPNGQVLVMGGLNGLTYLASVELYNPATGAWTSTGNLNVARQRFTATLLPNGQVLVAGGYGISGNYLASAELYDPTTGIWTVTGNLNNSRGDHTATLLLNGQVLVTGGDIPLYASCELYNPSTGTWTTTGSLNTSRMHHTATLLPNGRVLVAGGYNGNYPTTVELYNPTTGLWTVTGNLNIGRYSHTATLLPNGRVLFAGGTGYLNNLLTSSEVFDPVAGTSSTTGSLTNARYGHSATLLLNGQVLVAGGEGNAGTILASAEMYNPLTGIWTMMGSLNSPRYNHTANLLPTGQVLVSGGLGAGYLTSAELYNPGFGYTSATQPQLNAVSSVISASALSLTGTNFTGVSEASGGTTTNSASNIPVVQLQSLVNEQVINVPLDPSQGFSSTSFVSLPPIGLVPGYALLTMFVNGTPSLSQIVSYSSGVAPVITSSAPTSTATVGTPYNFTCTATGSPTPTFSVPPGALPTGLTLSSTGAISGTPTTPGLYTGTIQAGNGVSPVATQNFSITVNGTYAYWVSQYGLTGNQALPTAIVSPDGITNLMKYSQGLNPFTTYNPGSQSLPVVSFYESILGPSAENLFLTFTGTATDVTYNVQATSDLTGAWTTIKTFPSGGSSPPGTVTVEDTQAVGASPKRFMRLNVTIP